MLSVSLTVRTDDTTREPLEICVSFIIIRVNGLRSTQRYLSSFYYLFPSRHMFRWYVLLQVEIHIQWNVTRLAADP
jgi:hypothetical protein